MLAGNSELVVIHMPEGGYALTRAGEEVKVPSFSLPENEIIGAVGAGDAFFMLQDDNCMHAMYGYSFSYDASG